MGIIDVWKQFINMTNGVYEDVGGELEKLMNDLKPSVHIELQFTSWKYRKWLEKTLRDLGLYVFEDKHHDLCVSKFSSVAYWLRQISNNGFYRNAGVVGVILGYPLKEIRDYVERTGEEAHRRG